MSVPSPKRTPIFAAESLCPVCEAGVSKYHTRVDGYDYFQCTNCCSLHVDRATLDRIDEGKSTRVYDEKYWSEELRAARERADGVSLVRAGEAILYARRPVKRFLDVGTGPGFLLDALARHFPEQRNMFHGVELFPPDEHSSNPNYLVGNVGDLSGYFDAGTCIEVVEHLTPRMLKNLARGLAAISVPGSLWLFNTGMPEYVIGQDPAYLDPLHRGHIVSYGLKGVVSVFEPFEFRIRPIPGKSYAWFAEFKPVKNPTFEERVYKPLPENRALLEHSGLLFQAAFESARASVLLAYPSRAQSRVEGGPNPEQLVAREVWDEYQRMLHSRSWKVTAPLRVAARCIRAIRQWMTAG